MRLLEINPEEGQTVERRDERGFIEVWIVEAAGERDGVAFVRVEHDGLRAEIRGTDMTSDRGGPVLNDDEWVGLG